MATNAMGQPITDTNDVVKPLAPKAGAVVSTPTGVRTLVPPPVATPTGVQLQPPQPMDAPQAGGVVPSSGRITTMAPGPVAPPATPPSTVQPAQGPMMYAQQPAGAQGLGNTGQVTRPADTVPATSPQTPPGTTPVSGYQVPYNVLPQQSQGFQSMLGSLFGEANRQLQQPTIYDDELMGRAFEQGGRLLDERYDKSSRSLQANLARRGLSHSSVAAGDLNDLEVERGRAFQDMLTPLLRERATATGAGREAAFRNALGVAGFDEATGRGDRTELRGERQYVDQLSDKAQKDAIDNMMMQEMMRQARDSEFLRLLGVGTTYGMQGLGPMFNGGQLAGGAAGIYGNMAGQNADFWGQLAQGATGLIK